ncbi:MAG TPA: Rrf2 family transcriptional regulator [Candidatus Bathyarchaeia archaeon]|nr:Rrf2 family transcriptional regulator [Candidatus Bathyarchaeia archaeon]
MKLITKNSDYAVRALVYLAANPEGFVSAAAISNGQGIPYSFLRRLLQDLIQQGLVESREGAAGGVKLAKPASQISVAKVMEIFQGGIQISECMFRRKLCKNRGRCVLRKEILRIEGLIKKEFEAITVSKLLNAMGPS